MTTKKIWMYWDNGWDNAPNLVKQCKQSWVDLNPSYKVYALDSQTLSDHVDFPAGINPQRKDIPIQKFCNLVRLGLLLRHGGVWADATVMCALPLDSWLDEYRSSHFFAFREPGRDRMLSTWFLAAEPESTILQKYYERYTDYHANNYCLNQDTAFGNMVLKYLIPRWNLDFRTTLNWHSWFARKILRVYPYFIFHYTFNKLILEDPQCGTLWNEGKPFMADTPHRVQRLEKAKDGVARAKEAIDSTAIPMHKLNWRLDETNNYWAIVLPYLLAKVFNREP
jgi:hypothetical protein